MLFLLPRARFSRVHVSGEGIRPGPRKTVTNSIFLTPRNFHDMRRFIGLASCFRRFDFALITRLLTDLLRSKFEWKWIDERTNAFEVLKQKRMKDLYWRYTM